MAELSQLPDVVDIKFVAGDTFRIRIRVIDPDTTEAKDISDYSFAAWIATEDRTNVADFDVTTDPESAGTAVILTLPPAETAPLPSLGNGFEFTGKWDLEVIFPPVAPALVGDVRTVAKGSVTCYDDITHGGEVAPLP